MPQIDSSSIEGFDAMTAEEKVAALLSFEYDDGTAKLKEAETNAAKLKAAMDKATSEAAGYKKQLNATKSEEELKRQETEEKLQAMQTQLAEYEQREKISTAKSAFLGGGFDEATATDAADAFVSGDIAKMSAALKKYQTAITAQIKSSLMDSSPKPDGGDAAGSDDGEKGTSEFAETIGKMHAAQNEKSKSILDYYTRRD